MNIDEVYHAIAQNIVQAIEADWKHAEVCFERDEDYGGFKCSYSDSEGKLSDFDVSYSTYKNFKQLHLITSEDESNRWNKAKFTLYPTGKFNIDFEWDQDLADEIAANA